MIRNLRQYGTTITGIVVILASVASVFLGQASWQGAAAGIAAGGTLVFAAKDGDGLKRKR